MVSKNIKTHEENKGESKIKQILNKMKENSKKRKKINKKIEDKRLRILKKIAIALACIVVIELVYFGIKLYTIRKNTTYYSAINSVIESDDKLVAVGFSDSKNSDFIDYEKPGYNKPYIWVYNNKLKIEKEIQFEKGYNGQLNDIIKVDDGYVAVGAIEMSKMNHEEGNTEGMIIKYDKDFNIVWRKNLDVLGNTKLNAVKQLKDGNYVVVGTSVYPSDVIGNHTHGGAIIVKYSKDGEKLSITNYGGPKTGEFNDVLLLDDGLITVGVRSSGTGIIFKYDYNGNEIWHNYYGYTDTKGLTSITMLNDKEFIVTGSKLENKDETDNYQAALLKYNKDGKLIDETLYQKSKITRFQDSLILDDKIYVIGLYGRKVDDVLDNDSVLVIYDKELNEMEEKLYEGDNSYTLNKIISFDNSYLVAGHTDSKVKELKTNGLDYYPVLVK